MGIKQTKAFDGGGRDKQVCNSAQFLKHPIVTEDISGFSRCTFDTVDERSLLGESCMVVFGTSTFSRLGEREFL